MFRQLSIASLARHYVRHDIPNTYELYLSCTACQCRVPLRDAVGHAAFCLQVDADALDGALKPSNLADCFVIEPISAPATSLNNRAYGDSPTAIFESPTKRCEDEPRAARPQKRTPVDAYRCTQCDKLFLSRAEVAEHSERLHVVHPDPDCNYDSSPESSINSPSNVKAEPESDASEQANIGEPEQAFPCNYCAELFLLPSERYLHESEAHGEELRRERMPKPKRMKPDNQRKSSYSVQAEASPPELAVSEQDVDCRGMRQVCPCQYCGEVFLHASDRYLHENEKHSEALRRDRMLQAERSKPKQRARAKALRREQKRIEPKKQQSRSEVVDSDSESDDYEISAAPEQEIDIAGRGQVYPCRYCTRVFLRPSERYLHVNETHSRKLRRQLLAKKHTKPTDGPATLPLPHIKAATFVATSSRCGYCSKEGFASPTLLYEHMTEAHPG